MNSLVLLGKPHSLPLELYDSYLELELEDQNLEKDISRQIESLNKVVLVAYYDYHLLEVKDETDEDDFRDLQDLVD